MWPPGTWEPPNREARFDYFVAVEGPDNGTGFIAFGRNGGALTSSEPSVQIYPMKNAGTLSGYAWTGCSDECPESPPLVEIMFLVGSDQPGFRFHVGLVDREKPDDNVSARPVHETPVEEGRGGSAGLAMHVPALNIPWTVAGNINVTHEDAGSLPGGLSSDEQLRITGKDVAEDPRTVLAQHYGLQGVGLAQTRARIWSNGREVERETTWIEPGVSTSSGNSFATISTPDPTVDVLLAIQAGEVGLEIQRTVRGATQNPVAAQLFNEGHLTMWGWFGANLTQRYGWPIEEKGLEPYTPIRTEPGSNGATVWRYDELGPALLV